MHLKVPIMLLLLTMLLCGCTGREEQEGEEKTVVAEMPDQQSWNSEIILTSSGKKVAIVRAGHMAKFNDRKIVYLDENVSVDFFDDSEIRTSKLTSDSAEVHEKMNDLFAMGNVVVESDSGITLYTERLRWSNKFRKIVSEVNVMLTSSTDTLYGVGFESDASLENWTIKKPYGVAVRETDD